jgi:hypothetical protein
MFREFFSGNSGRLSFTRLACGVIIAIGCYAILHQLLFREVVDYLGPIGVIGTGLTGKVAQKPMEGKG